MLRLLALLLLAACSDTAALHARCAADGDCPVGFTCDASTGSCLCASDAACAANEFCNGLTCQRRVGCDTSLDCPSGQFCDRTTGNCLDADRCTEDVQCPIGQVCDSVRYACVDGCRDAGDCALGQVCRCGKQQSCAVGACEGNGCDDDSYCHYGERCLTAEDGTRRCVKDTRGPYCEGCSYDPGDASHCGGAPDEANFCLLDRKVTYRHTYCGVDCSSGQACPWGYRCRNILVLTRALCHADADCPATGADCQSDADCPGARCDQASKRCAGTCSFNEDSQSGFCTCTADRDCPRETCDPTSYRCTITRKPCTPEGGECERAIYCVNQGTRAACLIGKNCTPEDGLKCEDVRQ